MILHQLNAHFKTSTIYVIVQCQKGDRHHFQNYAMNADDKGEVRIHPLPS